MFKVDSEIAEEVEKEGYMAFNMTNYNVNGARCNFTAWLNLERKKNVLKLKGHIGSDSDCGL